MERDELFQKFSEDLKDSTRDDLLWLLVDTTKALSELQTEIMASAGVLADDYLPDIE